MNERPKQTAFPLWEAVCLKTAQAPYVILYEDDAVLVCTKKAGTPVQSKNLRTPDLESMLRMYLAKRQSGAPYLGIVHRLDQPVCGVLVFAKTPKAAAALSKQVQDGTMRKEYLAVCSTSLQQDRTAGQKDTCAAMQRNAKAAGQKDAGADDRQKIETACGQTQMLTVTDYLVKDGRTNLSRVVPEGTKGAKRAVLEMEVLKTYGQQSLVHVRLHTGRHHQIRVQLAHFGCPIVGDKKYGMQAEQGSFTQLMLCAYRLVFTHPVTGKQMDFDLSEEKIGGISEWEK